MAQTNLTQHKKVLLILFVSLFAIFSYTFLHEGGHALAALLSGGRVTSFSVNFLDLSAHVGLDGNFTLSQKILINVAGAGLPLLVWLVLVLALPKRSDLAMESLKTIFSLITLNTLLAWVVLPLVFLAGEAPVDDVTNFLKNSGFPPLVLSLLALLLYIGGWLLYRSRITSLRGELELFRKADQEVITPETWKRAGVMLVVFILFGVTAFSANGFRLTTGWEAVFQPPPGSALVATINLSDSDREQETVYTFTIEQAQTAGVYLLVEDINTQYVDLTLTGPAGYQKMILHGEGYAAGQDSPHLEELLQAGQYLLVLTSQKSPGKISVYVWK